MISLKETMGDRIFHIIKMRGLKKVEFARILNIDQSYVTQLIKGRNMPSNRLIEDICQKFNINTSWLCDGIGYMYRTQHCEAEILSWAAKLAYDTRDTFPRKLALALSRLDEKEWTVLEHLAYNIFPELTNHTYTHCQISINNSADQDNINAKKCKESL